MMKNIAISTYLIAFTLLSLLSILSSVVVDSGLIAFLEIYTDIILIMGGVFYLRKAIIPKWVFWAGPAVAIQAFLFINDGCYSIETAIWFLFLTPLFFFSYKVAFTKPVEEIAELKANTEKTKNKFSMVITYFILPVIILLILVSGYIFASGGRYYFYLPFASKIALKHDAHGLAESYANEMLSIAESESDDWNKGNAIFSANIILGRIALKKGKIAIASEHLIKAGETPGSPQLNSFGPGMGLARDLLKHNEKVTVIQYLELCKVFWELENGQIDQWIILINNGETPNFHLNSGYY